MVCNMNIWIFACGTDFTQETGHDTKSCVLFICQIFVECFSCECALVVTQHSVELFLLLFYNPNVNLEKKRNQHFSRPSVCLTQTCPIAREKDVEAKEKEEFQSVVVFLVCSNVGFYYYHP